MTKSQYEEGLETREQIIKAWGIEEILVTNDLYTGKLLWISPGWQCSLHKHNIKQETFVALDGLTRVEYYINNKRYDTILVGWRRDALTIPTGTYHRFWALGGDGSLLLEISTKHDDADVVRAEPSKRIGDLTPEERDTQ